MSLAGAELTPLSREAGEADEEAEGAQAASQELVARQKAMLKDPTIAQYAIAGSDAEWKAALAKGGGAVPRTISMKSDAAKDTKKRARDDSGDGSTASGKDVTSAKKKKKDKNSKGKDKDKKKHKGKK